MKWNDDDTENDEWKNNETIEDLAINWVMIRRCKFLLADLTHGNKGAYWESGYAEGLGKHVIYLCKKEIFDKEKTHFDTNHCTTVIWDSNNIDEAVENLKATIRTTFPEEALITDKK